MVTKQEIKAVVVGDFDKLPVWMREPVIDPDQQQVIKKVSKILKTDAKQLRKLGMREQARVASNYSNMFATLAEGQRSWVRVLLEY